MLSFEPNIIFIDDKEDEVIELIEKYRKEGIGCKFYNADVVDGNTQPDKPFSDVNLIFLDLYYDSTNFDVELCTGWIESIIPKDSFYVLVIWSRDTHHTEAIEEDLIKIKRKPYVIFPFLKGMEYKNEDGSWKIEKLYDDINTKVKECHPLEELGLWKKNVKSSSNSIIGHLTKDLESNELLIKKLQKIIIGHGGKSFISEDKQLEKREVLFDALDNILISNSKGTLPNTIISSHNSDSLYKIGENIESDIDSKLNSWFHFKLHKEPLDNKLQIGIITTYENEFLKNTYSLQDDEVVKKYIKTQIDESKELIDITLLISRPCDIAQEKFGKNLKLISGLIIKNPKRKENLRKDIKLAQKPDSIKLYDHLYFSTDQDDVALIFDFRYVFSVPENIFCKKFKKIKVFNKELLSEMQVEYSAYSSRLGITQVI